MTLSRHDIAGQQHGSNLLLKLKRLRRKRGIVCAEDAIVAKLDSELFLESFLDVDPGDAEAFLLEGLRRAAPNSVLISSLPRMRGCFTVIRRCVRSAMKKLHGWSGVAHRHQTLKLVKCLNCLRSIHD